MNEALAYHTIETLEERLAAWGFRTSHARRLLRTWHHGDGVVDETRLCLPGGLRERLAGERPRPVAEEAARQVSTDGTTKLLLRLVDSRSVESVLMPDYAGRRMAGCVSSQVGCAMACDFCATTKGGLERDLAAPEIVAQFLALRREARARGCRLQTLVFMGMGEPLLNLDEVLEAATRIADNRYGGLGWRQVTISTVGVVPGIERLTATGLGFHLAVSLHAPDDETRRRLIPTGRRWTIADILAAADRFQARRGRPVTIQYCLLDGVNDSIEHAHTLAALLGSRRMHVNLLTYNPTGTGLRGVEYRATPPARAQEFCSVLRARDVVTHFRRSRGPDIDAACGQLRQRAATADQRGQP